MGACASIPQSCILSYTIKESCDGTYLHNPESDPTHTVLSFVTSKQETVLLGMAGELY